MIEKDRLLKKFELIQCELTKSEKSNCNLNEQKDDLQQKIDQYMKQSTVLNKCKTVIKDDQIHNTELKNLKLELSDVNKHIHSSNGEINKKMKN